MKFQCCQCTHLFDERDALCEDWSNPERSFICPACETCLIREDSDSVISLHRNKTARQYKRYIILSIILIALVKPLLYLADRGAIGLFIIGIMVAAMVLYLRKKPNPPQKTFRVFHH